uniref:Ig-like domain-containing protein n=1 Tax=Laticauda laticaudata TaxID=8630 RepID=A0A8C5SF73_LATLA
PLHSNNQLLSLPTCPGSNQCFISGFSTNGFHFLLPSGERALDWLLPNNQTGLENRVALTECARDNYCKMLTLTEVIGNDTGSYKCFYQDNHTSSSVYVYVQAVYITGNKTVVVPCLGSSSNLNVSLHSVSAYCLYCGAKILFFKNVSDTPHHLFVSQLYVQWSFLSDFVPLCLGYKIHDLSMGPLHQVELAAGEKLSLNCTAKTELNVRIEFQWDFPSKQVTEGGSFQIQEGFAKGRVMRENTKWKRF